MGPMRVKAEYLQEDLSLLDKNENVQADSQRLRLLEKMRHWYRPIACNWLLNNNDRWQHWVQGHTQKQDLSIIGMFALYGSWVMGGLKDCKLY
ncbi:unnamed protein product [Protopolystoma xenopodis]|uniref:Uncharacterized protein n=1 Tax=Protopolystoma xenopodis TaxID=117903 RepID=A0A3S5AA99_9PLAT|nr:unnamed protein product [Protopolystoma xenopodis]